MPLAHDLSQAQIAFHVQGGEPDQFLVTRFRGSEGLCRLYQFEIDLTSAHRDAGLGECVGKAAVLIINTPSGPRWFHGIINRFELTGESADQNYYRAELVPNVWLLTQRHQCRNFQNRSTPQIVSEVLTTAGIPADRFRLTLQQCYDPREYCVQYRETDYNFIARLMEEEGIWWYFEQTQDGHVLVLADSAAAYAPIEGESILPYESPTGLATEADHVASFKLGEVVRHGPAAVTDFNFKNPALPLHARHEAERHAGLEFFDCPGGYDSQHRGAELARMRTEEFDAYRVLGKGRSNCPRLALGRTFELCGHPSTIANGRYLLRSITHQGRQSTHRTSNGKVNGHGRIDARLEQLLGPLRQDGNPDIRRLAEAVMHRGARDAEHAEDGVGAAVAWQYHRGQLAPDPVHAAAANGNPDLQTGGVTEDAPVYQCHFECIPAESTYRPVRMTPRPVVHGAQTARVVGPENEEICCDEYGRVKVQFHWDRQGREAGRPKPHGADSSCWIRVSQGMAGGQYGIMFLPRVGQEVVVDFLEGDPDRPIITGRVYNGDHMPPYPLPQERTKSCIKTLSSPRGGGGNEIRFEDLKGQEQLLLFAERDLHLRARNDQVETVERDHHLIVQRDALELVKQNRHSTVKLDLNQQVGGKLSLEVRGDVAEEFKAHQSTQVGQNLSVKAGQNVVIEAGASLTLKAMGNFITIDAGGVTIMGTMVKINSGGSAGIGSPISATTPSEPIEADTVTPGRNLRYTQEVTEGLAQTCGDAMGLHPAPDRASERLTSWIEIELVDEIGQPVPKEPYEIIAPDGETIHRGSLAQHGQAHVAVREPGLCRICFPKLDLAAWDRAGTNSPVAARSAPVATASLNESGCAPSSNSADDSPPSVNKPVYDQACGEFAFGRNAPAEPPDSFPRQT